MADPANIFAIDDLRIVTGKEIRPVVAAESDLVAAIDRFSAGRTNVDDMVGDLEQAVARSATDGRRGDGGRGVARSPDS